MTTQAVPPRCECGNHAVPCTGFATFSVERDGRRIRVCDRCDGYATDSDRQWLITPEQEQLLAAWRKAMEDERIAATAMLEAEAEKKAAEAAYWEANRAHDAAEDNTAVCHRAFKESLR